MFRSKSKKKQPIPVYVDNSYIYGSQYPPPPVWYSPDIFGPSTSLKQKKHRNTWSFFEPSSHHHNHKSHKSSRKLPKSVHFTPSVIDRDEDKENTKRSRTFAEFFSGYTSRQKDTKKRYKDYRREENHVSATVDPRVLRDRDERKYRRYDDRKHDHDHRSHHRRERSHSESHVHFQPESIYYLGDSTSEPLFLSPRESRERRQRERNLEKFLAENHGRDRYAQSRHEYIERKQVPPGPGLRRKKGFWRGAPV
ncbi:hypothetical protein BZA77DRAFT_310155 [Pyronema omphalodes]|nr:hypothetical protein BZA77DRAFT_310155 [Pyronema omphalodes]